MYNHNQQVKTEKKMIIANAFVTDFWVVFFISTKYSLNLSLKQLEDYYY